MTKKVRLLFILTGRSHRDKRAINEMDSRETHACMLNQISERFGERPIHITTKNSRTVNSLAYPEFYAAGWFVTVPAEPEVPAEPGDEPALEVEEKESELVVVSHGDSMDRAQKNLMAGVQNVAWDELAKSL